MQFIVMGVPFPKWESLAIGLFRSCDGREELNGLLRNPVSAQRFQLRDKAFLFCEGFSPEALR